jgi:hypothetical protein
MTHDSPVGSPQIGYLSILPHAEFGYFGGYLVLDSRGRPLEFQCTAPVRPSRAQEILYGPTLRCYVVGELIGATLLDKARFTPPFVLTDQLDALCLASQKGLAMACTLPPRLAPDVDEIAVSKDDLSERVEAGGFVFTFVPIGGLSAAEGAELLSRLSGAINLLEPFDRIREAIGEAQRITTDGPSDLAQAG